MKAHLWKPHSFNSATFQTIPRYISNAAGSQQRKLAGKKKTTLKRMRFAPHPSTAELPETGYATWNTSSLIARITELENQLNSQASNGHNPPSPSAESSASRPAATGSAAISPAPENSYTRTPSPSPSKTSTTSSNQRARREIDPSKYSTRFIALKFSYLGQRYNGYEHANGNVTSLPTIEEELWKALRKTRLIFPPGGDTLEELNVGSGGSRGPYSISWEGCDYSKCGRTDRGVSAFGQVIGIRVRSSKPMPSAGKDKPPSSESTNVTQEGEAAVQQQGENSPESEEFMNVMSRLDDSDAEENPEPAWDSIANELPYLQILNNVLPEDIRMLAWCPNPPPDFSARFSCRERQYRYLFTQPAFTPTPGPMGFLRGAGTEKRNEPGAKSKYREGWLDIEAMREGAKYLEGSHDFRNLCKLDTSKQTNNFVRQIFHADIEPVDAKSSPLGYVKHPDFQPYQNPADAPSVESDSDKHCPSAAQVYTFTVHGSAFLWHQVRHMASVLFLIGQGLEPPSLMKELLDVEKNPRRPSYELASDAPLVLWNCVFPDEESDSREDVLDWVYAGDPRTLGPRPKKRDSKFGTGGTVDGIWSLWRQKKIDEILAGSLLDQMVSQGGNGDMRLRESKSQSQKVFYGANEARLGGKYIPMMERWKLDTVEEQNAKYLVNKKANKEKQAQNGEVEQ